MKNGSLSSTMFVFENFPFYRSGVFKSSGKVIAPLSVKIIGWGRERRTNYWIVMNTWNKQWGENGTVRIEFNDKCLVDYFPITAKI